MHAVERCAHCQRDPREVAPVSIQRRQVVELPPTHIIIREHQAECKRCPSCQQQTTAAFPAEVRAPVQYGASIAARAVYFSQQQLLPLARTASVIEDLLGVWLSEGTVGEMLSRCAGFYLLPGCGWGNV